MSDRSPSQHIHEFIRHLLSAIAAAGLYGMEHHQVLRLTEVAHGSLSHALTVRPDIAMLEIEGELVIDSQPQPFTLVLARFTQYLRTNGIGHLRFLAGAPRTELEQLIASLTNQQGASELGSSDHIRVGRVELSGAGGESANFGSDDGTADASGQVSLQALPAVELQRMTEVYEAIKRKERLKPSGVAATVAELVNAFKREGEAILVVAALREQDEYTFTHAANVCILTMAQAISLGIQGQLLNDIGMSAMLHDIGKMFVPDEILNKPEKLTDQEFDIMKRHPANGARYLLETAGIPRLAAIVAYEHHMRDDFSGYPSAPSGWRLNLASQLTAIADFFDAMRTRRPYKQPLEPRAIVNLMISKAGNEFNPYLLRNFLQLMSRLNKL